MNKTTEHECQYFIELDNNGKIIITSKCYKEQNGKALPRDLDINGQQVYLCQHHYEKVMAGEE